MARDDSRTPARAARRATAADAEAGDWIEVAGVGGADPRRGEIVAVLGSGEHLHFEVRWSDEHESLFYPDPAARGFIVHVGSVRSAGRPDAGA